MTVKVFNYNPVSEMTDSEILDYLEDCYKDSYSDNDHLITYARSLQFVCEIKGLEETLKFNKKKLKTSSLAILKKSQVMH